MALLLLKIVLLVLSIHAVLKPLFFYILKYDIRRKQLDKSYGNKKSATTLFDNLIFFIMIGIVILLLLSHSMAYLSFIAGLYIGATLIQTYFHAFSSPLSDDKAPKPPVSPIKMMSYAIQANPEKPWKQLTLISLLFIWGIYMILTNGF